MSTAIAAIVVFVVLAAIVAALKSRPFTSDQNYPYRQADEFLSKAERSFYSVLRQAVGEHGIVFAKVRVADVLATKHGLSASKRQSAFNKIQSKHFDFVVCSPAEIAPKVAVELDDASHRGSARAKRDVFLNRVAEVAGLPLLRIPAKKGYAIAHLKEQLAPHIEPSHPPTCPKCGSGMVHRQGKSGALAGKKFWGCGQYPKC